MVADGRPPKPSIEDAAAALGHLLSQPHRLQRTLHSNTRGRERTFDDLDIRRVLDRGTVVSVEWHQQTRKWVFVVSGRDLEGDELTLVVYVNQDERELRVLTGR